MDNHRDNIISYNYDGNIVIVERCFLGQTDINSIVKSIVIDKSSKQTAED